MDFQSLENKSCRSNKKDGSLGALRFVEPAPKNKTRARSLRGCSPAENPFSKLTSYGIQEASEPQREMVKNQFLSCATFVKSRHPNSPDQRIFPVRSESYQETNRVKFTGLLYY